MPHIIGGDDQRAASQVSGSPSVLLGLAGGTAGCVPQGVPAWAMHVQPTRTDPQRGPTTSPAVSRTSSGTRASRTGTSSPEQIAVVAVRELERGRLADAQLWLAVASYRYHQEAIGAADGGDAGFGTAMMYGVSRDAYYKLVLAEVKRFARLGFNDELSAVEARRLGRDEKERALAQQLASLGEGDRDRPRVAPRRLVGAAPGHRRRRRQDPRPGARRGVPAPPAPGRGERPEGSQPAHLPGAMPVLAAKEEAIYSTSLFFEPVLCDDVSNAFPALRPAMLKALAAGRPQARANAAASMGMAPSEETKTALRVHLATETDARVKLVVEYALALHGELEQVLPIATALQSCQGDACTLPVSLLQWLPQSARRNLDQAPLARVVGDKKAAIRARIMAALILGAIGREKPLEPGAIEALIAAARFRREDNERFQIDAAEAVQETSTLSRADVLARIAAQNSQSADVLHPCALLARLARLAIADDLPLLKRMMARFGESEGPEPFFIVDATLAIHDPQSDALLMGWFPRYPKLQSQIAAGLASRDTTPRDVLDRLVAQGGVRAQLVYKAVRHEDLRARITMALQSESPEDRFNAAEIAGLSAQEGVTAYLYPLLAYTDARYYPNDALLRHAAMEAILRITLAGMKPPRAPAAAKKAEPAAPPEAATPAVAAPPAPAAPTPGPAAP